MITVYLICFVLGLVMSLLAAFTGLGRIHFGHVHFGRIHLGHVHPGHAPAAHGHAFVHGGQTPSSAHARAGSTQSGTEISALNGFTLPAFLCWFGGVGYLLASRTPMARVLVLLAAVLAGMVGAMAIYALIFKLLLPRERVLGAEETRMEGVLARISDEVRAPNGLGEILFSQGGTRRSAPARSEDGRGLPRGTEVVVLHFERGVATVRPMGEFGEGLVGEGGPIGETQMPVG